MDLTLDAEEIRILGSLLEKEITTPEYYPLSGNALLNACNQKSNRDPVLHLDEDTFERAIYTLRDKGLLVSITGAGSRVPKYGHRISEKLNLGRRELAILCELMLRGPQTLGELRTRAERMHPFGDLAEVESVLEHMPELVIKLPRRPGEKGQLSLDNKERFWHNESWPEEKTSRLSKASRPHCGTASRIFFASSPTMTPAWSTSKSSAGRMA